MVGIGSVLHSGRSARSSHSISNYFIHTLVIVLIIGARPEYMPLANDELNIEGLETELNTKGLETELNTTGLETKLYFEPMRVNIVLDEELNVTFVEKDFKPDTTIWFNVTHKDLVELSTMSINTTGEALFKHQFTLTGEKPGHTDMTIDIETINGTTVNVPTVYMLCTVMRSRSLYVLASIIGWMYFAAWSISFYPQIITNYLRQSVIGLNFDFLALNLLGFLLYSMFNCGLFFFKIVQDEYFYRHPRSLNPVLLNDVVFSLHAVFATLFTISQCLIYQRGGQAMSCLGRLLMVMFVTAAVVLGVMSGLKHLHWLDFLYVCSYIKLFITLIKYIPQAYMNFRRKSTAGWSIGNIFLDFTGGLLSILQMLINAFNFDDWDSLLGDPTKLGLGIFSLLFDVIFILQHYVLYRDHKSNVSDSSEDEHNMLTTKSVDGKDYFLVDANWNADDKKYELENKA